VAAAVRPVWRWLTLAAALWLLNAALVFQNAWPTVRIHVDLLPQISPELLWLVGALLVWAALARRAPAAAVAGALAGLWLLLALVRYAQETAPALYGRPIDLYWDAPHVGSVLRMLATTAGSWLTLAAAGALLLALLAAFLGLRLAWRRVLAALGDRRERGVIGALTALAAAGWLVGQLPGAPESWPQRYAASVSVPLGPQLEAIAHSFAAQAAAPEVVTATASPQATARFAALGSDDVLLVFVESYGGVTYSRPEFADALVAAREELASAVVDTGRRAVSTTVLAPTFGGYSWLSHLSLLAGVEVAAPDAYVRTMQRPRPNLVQTFARAGYSTLALMPGLRQPWPEGAFYAFDTILGADALDYRGPEFGWWRIPDQFALARLDELPRPDRAPRFTFFTTISSHTPFRPTPPYQPDWARLTSATPYGAEAARALAVEMDWENLGPAYVESIDYVHAWLAGYLRRHAAADLTLIVLGDHQPPAVVSGRGADWTVPVHVITRRDDVLRALEAQGFVAGLAPPSEPLARTHELNPLLTRAFAAAPAGATAAVAPTGRHGGRGSIVDAPRVDVARRPDLRPVDERAP